MVEKPLNSESDLAKNGTKAPAQLHQLALTCVTVGADDRLHGGGSDVVVPRRQRKVVDLCGVEGFDDLLLVALTVVAAAHSITTKDLHKFVISNLTKTRPDPVTGREPLVDLICISVEDGGKLADYPI